MLYLVGLGLSPSMTTREAMDALKQVETVYLDVYTNYFDQKMLKEWKYYIGDFEAAERVMLEDRVTEFVLKGKNKDIALAVSGDVFVATTHSVVASEAVSHGIKVKYIPGVSIITYALSIFGLQHYKMGRVVTVPYLWRSSPSFFEKLSYNIKKGLHTVLLLDLYPEPLTLGDVIEAVNYWNNKYGTLDDVYVGVISRAGWDDCKLFSGHMNELKGNFKPPITVVVPGKMHPLEEEIFLEAGKLGNCR